MPPNPEPEDSSLLSRGAPDPQSEEHPPSTDTETGGAKPGPSSSEVTVEEKFPSERDFAGEGAPPPAGGGGDQIEGEAPEFSKMSFLDHLEELRRRIIHSIIAILLGFAVYWTFADDIYAALAWPLTNVLRELHLDEHLVYTNPTAPFTLYVQLALLAGLFVASPFVIWQVWRFISPGLYPHERKYAIPFILLCSVLFLAGGAFAYAIGFPAALRFLLNFGSRFRPMITVNEYFSLATMIILGMALVFELPVLILLLTLLRVITPRFLLRNTRYAILLIFIAAAAITPTPDVPTMMLFATPLIGLYFFGIGLSYLVLRLRSRRKEG